MEALNTIPRTQLRMIVLMWLRAVSGYVRLAAVTCIGRRWG